jgi:hypothetical protein
VTFEEYWKMQAFNCHELGSERITIEQVLGMMARRCHISYDGALKVVMPVEEY